MPTYEIPLLVAAVAASICDLVLMWKEVLTCARCPGITVRGSGSGYTRSLADAFDRADRTDTGRGAVGLVDCRHSDSGAGADPGADSAFRWASIYLLVGARGE